MTDLHYSIQDSTQAGPSIYVKVFESEIVTHWSKDTSLAELVQQNKLSPDIVAVAGEVKLEENSNLPYISPTHVFKTVP